MAPSKETTQCSICKKNITKTQPTIQCSSCSNWFHLPCVGVSEKSFAALVDTPNLYFKCRSDCSKSATNDDDDSIGNDIRSIHDKIDRILRKIDDEKKELNAKLDLAINNFRTELSSTASTLHADISSCNNAVAAIEASSHSKFSQLEIENNCLHRRLNRSDIVINGLPPGLNNLHECMSNIASYYDVALSKGDINNIFYINQSRSVVVKLNSVHTRDFIMKEYFKRKTLNLANVIGGEISSRVYLNDHLSPACSKLNLLAKRLLKQKKILKFWLPHSDKPVVHLTCLDGSQVVHDYSQCLKLL